ncbi:hypothetical protein PENTCL1PPCAC_8726, partial [Pristionchus entomophagus]
NADVCDKSTSSIIDLDGNSANEENRELIAVQLPEEKLASGLSQSDSTEMMSVAEFDRWRRSRKESRNPFEDIKCWCNECGGPINPSKGGRYRCPLCDYDNLCVDCVGMHVHDCHIDHVDSLEELGEGQDEVDHESFKIFQHQRLTLRSADFESEFDTKFQPIGILGRGTFGCVFKAQNKLDEFKYAVKRIPVQGREMDLKKALLEVQAMANFKHPGIIQYNHSWMEKPPDGFQRWHDEKMLYELKSNEYFVYKKNCSFLYIQMELCNSSLAAWLSENTNRDVDKIKSWFCEIVSAVDYVHAMGKIHRDLKPCNILLGCDGQLKVCDLGIVTNLAFGNEEEELGDSIERTFAKGTPKYMAPEQFYWEYSHKVDIFALGLILAEMCVVMSDEKADEVFNNYRENTCNSILDHIPEVKEFVAWLTKYAESDRPECTEILDHSFLKSIAIMRVNNSQSVNHNALHREFDQLDDASPNNRSREPIMLPNCIAIFESEFLKKFVPISIIGGGSYSTVFKAHNLLDDRMYAVKRVSTNRDASEYFDEVRALAPLKHEGIIGYNSVWKEEPPAGWQHHADRVISKKMYHDESDMLSLSRKYDVFVYCQMELFFHSLDGWLYANEERDLIQAKLWFKQLTEAVSYLHSMNMIHRDIKPSNIFFGGNGRLIIGDL